MDFRLNTQRLQLAPFSEDESPLFHQINTDPFVRKYLWDDEVIPQEVAIEIMARNARHFQEDGFGLWKIKLTEGSDIIGYTGLWYFFDEPQPQLLYALLEPYSGMGYATEAAAAIVDYVFENLSFTYLLAATDEPHEASQKVAQRLGMSLTERRIEEGKPTLFFRIDKEGRGQVIRSNTMA